MEFNNKKLARTSRWVNYLIAAILCLFLIALANRVMWDVDDWKERPQISEFENQESKDALDQEINKIEKNRNALTVERDDYQRTLNLVKQQNRDAKQSYDNWLMARSTIGSPDEDPEIREKLAELDEIAKVERDWNEKVVEIQTKISELSRERDAIENQKSEELEAAYALKREADRKYDFNIFLIRLVIVLPILLIAIWFIFRFRKHKYWPLFLGFVLFAFYAFFVGLIPYLPSYGGYIRFTVGIILSILLGIYFINKIRGFIERKKNELKESTTDRAKKVKYETAEKAFDDHMCPSCGKDFIVRNWERAKNKKNPLENFSFVTNFCRFCGLELFKKCNNCNHDNYAHLPFCSNCGDPTNAVLSVNDSNQDK